MKSLHLWAEYSSMKVHESVGRATINAERLWNDIMTTACWGNISSTTGMARLALTDDDKLVRDWFTKSAREIGCHVKIDTIGNIFAILPGENMDIPPIAMGSHLDTQPAASRVNLGGRFDGILGVIGALEVLRTVREHGIRTYAPLAAINWTNEEGARFTPGCTGSAVWSSHANVSVAQSLPSNESSYRAPTMVEELERIGYLGSHVADYRSNPLSAHFELHIEQNTRLESQGKLLGVVEGVQGIKWYNVTCTGEQAHAGSTPMDRRADALVATAKIITALDHSAHVNHAFATVGVVELSKSSSNTVAGKSEFTIDLRHPSPDILDMMEQEFRANMIAIENENPKISFSTDLSWHSPAVRFDKKAVECVASSAELLVGPEAVMRMDSFAGHDSALTAARVPTAMIFVPSKGGISHAPDEYTGKEQCAIGAQALFGSVLAYDTLLRHDWEKMRG